MASTWNLSKGLAAVVTASAAAFGLCPSAAADPAAPPTRTPTQQLPGLPALSQLSPIIQQAASNPAQATQLLMAAAQAFSHNPTAPTESKNVAASVNQFVPSRIPIPGCAPRPHPRTPSPDAAPVPHVPPAGVEPGAQAHLPTGIDPAHAAGPGARRPRSATAAAPRRPAARPRRRTAPASPAPAARRAGAGPAPAPAPAAAPGFRPRRPAHAGLHVSLDRHQLPCGRQ